MLKRGLVLAAIVALLDQATKLWILSIMLPRPPGERTIGVVPVFDIVLVWNRGVSFGLFNNNGTINAIAFSLLAGAIIVLLLVWLRRARTPMIAAGVGLVIGGAVGNVVDRLRIGAVVDFLDFHVAGWHWPAFNVADAAICIGVGLLLLDSLLGRGETRTYGA
ncbi:MAG TPA: signal peptidase II [Stellaceae bacterium]|jgi:signal peptidase II